MRKIIIIGMCILTILFLSGAGYRFYLSQYQEECYLYRIDMINYTCSRFHWDYNRECDEGYIKFCKEEANYLCCESICYRWNVTNECIKYHLVRVV